MWFEYPKLPFYFELPVFVLCIYCEMFYLFDVCILMGNLDISFGICDLSSYLSVCEYGFIILCTRIVFHVLNAILIGVSL
jgi:hypothetical protein